MAISDKWISKAATAKTPRASTLPSGTWAACPHVLMDRLAKIDDATAVALYVLQQTWLTKVVELPTSQKGCTSEIALTIAGFTTSRRHRAIKKLEAAGILKVEPRNGRSTRLTLLS